MIKYAIYPGYAQSKNDGDIHYIGVAQLVKLYQVHISECIIIDSSRPETYEGWTDEFLKSLIHLRPRYDGRYPIFRNDRA